MNKKHDLQTSSSKFHAPTSKVDQGPRSSMGIDDYDRYGSPLQASKHQNH